jgi:hypothetical protein
LKKCVVKKDFYNARRQTDRRLTLKMSFMTGIVFSWILFIIIFTVYELASLDNNNVDDLFYMIKREKRQQGDDDIGPVIFAYTAVIAAIALPQMHQID